MGIKSDCKVQLAYTQDFLSLRETERKFLLLEKKHLTEKIIFQIYEPVVKHDYKTGYYS